MADETCGGFLLEADFFVRAEARVDHEGEVERLLCFGFEDFDLLFDAFFEDVKRLARDIDGGTIVFVENTGEDANELHVDADAAALLLIGGRIVGGDWLNDRRRVGRGC